MKQRSFAAFLAAGFIFILSGCQHASPSGPDFASESIQYATSEPESLAGVLEQIYQTIDLKGLQDASSEDLSELFHLEADRIDDFAVRFSNGRYGVADIAILRPEPEYQEEALSALKQRQEDRIAEFENYDIHDSLRIAQEAEAFIRGDYVILLMIDDIETARRIIYENIPG